MRSKNLYVWSFTGTVLAVFSLLVFLDATAPSIHEYNTTTPYPTENRHRQPNPSPYEQGLAKPDMAAAALFATRISPDIMPPENPTPPRQDSAFLSMPISTLIDGLINDDEDATLWGAAALQHRAQEAAPYIESVLRDGNAYERYSVARLLHGSAAKQHQRTLLETATDTHSHYLARVGSLYGLRSISLDSASANRILDIAATSSDPLVRRTALIALSGSNLEHQTDTLFHLLDSEDPFCCVFAARLLGKQGLDYIPDALVSLTTHGDPLVRQEAYAALGAYTTPQAHNLLVNAAAHEPHSAAARALRLALFRHHIRQADTTEAHEMAIRELVQTPDNHERWLSIQYALHHDNKQWGMEGLRLLAKENSELGIMARAQLATLPTTTHAHKHNTAPDAKTTAPKHFIEIHRTMAEYCVTWHNEQSILPTISQLAKDVFVRHVVREDRGINPVTHAHNPVTGRGFVRTRGFGGSARRYAVRLFDQLDVLHDKPHFSEADLSDGWRLAGRVFHLLQDMASPLHVFSVWHVLNSCHYEVYWDTVVPEALSLADARETQTASPPQLTATSTTQLDDFTRQALEERIATLPNTLMGHQDTVTWSAYYRASFWGEIRYDATASAPETLPSVFDDGSTEHLPNVLHNMFDGNIRYHTAWWGDYFLLEDRKGNTFHWNRLLALDEWRPCPNPRGKQVKDGHTRGRRHMENGTDIMSITGRFLFTHRGRTPYCHPFRFPNGDTMTTHLPRYYGETLLPLMVAYGNGWLAALSEQYPKLFDEALMKRLLHDDIGLADDGTKLQRLLAFLHGFATKFGADSDNQRDTLSPWETWEQYMPRCGCRW